MCGFAGFVGLPLARDAGLSTLGKMAATLVRRGPDEEGLWLGADAAVGLAHRRLAVVGLGPDGRQPMASASGRWVIAYNGEIYNFQALRAELVALGARFRGGSDTEVVLAAVEAWGLDAALGRFVGMFAFALWDQQQRVLHLARDRFGEKPLYYGWQGRSFLFGSDLAALRAHPEWEGGVDRAALAMLVRCNHVPCPLSIHPKISKLEAGTRLELAARDGRFSEKTLAYWSPLQAALRAREAPFQGSEAEAVEVAHDLLRQAVAGQLVAEVPLGAFLSGGIDSSTIVALMQSVSPQPVRTFTIGFADAGYDESADAGRIAAHLGTSHRSRTLAAEDALAMIPQLPAYYSEPFADASQIATALVARMAREEVTVALSGDGGDEVFGGYNRYLWAESLWRRTRLIPDPVRSRLGRFLLGKSPATWDAVFAALPAARAIRQPGEKLHKLTSVLGAASPRDVHQRLTSFWHEGNPVLAARQSARSQHARPDSWQSPLGMTENMMLADTLNYLPDDILVKVDRAAMGFSLETRVPFLDHRLFEFVWSLPLEFRIGRRGGKQILRRILDRYVPRNLVERPKSGFALPIHDWMRGSLRPWCEELLDEQRLRREGFFDARVVRQAWDEHLSGRRNRQYELWSILMFQAWHEAQQ